MKRQIVLNILIIYLITFTNCLATSEWTNFQEDEDFESISPVAKFFDQNIDHSGDIGGTFKQLYYESFNAEGYTNNLKFLYIGGETALSTSSVIINFMSILADQFLADKYSLEHRFYGQSQPFKDLSTENLKYLTIEQSIEDIKQFIEFINSKTENDQINNKWILFGGSYAGNLAAWTRMKYPELIFGAVASSAPVQAQYNFKEYLEMVTQIIKNHDSKCYNIIKTGMNQLVHTFKIVGGKEKLKTMFRMCESPNDQFDKYSLTSFIARLFSEAVEYNTKIKNSANRISLLCTDLKNRAGNHLEKLSSLVADHYTIDSQCFNYNYNSNYKLFKTEIDQYGYERQWHYQRCTELGYFPTTASNLQPFAHALPMIYYTKLCRDAFGESFNEQTIKASISETNIKYKGKDIKDVGNLIMIHGSADPWSTLGVQSFINNRSTAIITKDGWHCQDMAIPNENDPIEVRVTRSKLVNIIEQWTAD